jgi:hypothetical protein
MATVSGNKKVETLLKRIINKKGVSHWGEHDSERKEYHFFFDTGTTLTATMYYEPKKKNNSYLIETQRKGFYDGYGVTYINCTNLRGKKIYDALRDQFKMQNNPPYKGFIY